MTRIAAGFLVITLAVTPLAAHHSFAMFEMETELKIVGTVTEVKWQNPHIHIGLRVDKDTAADPKLVGNWDIEGAAIAIISRQGWSKNTLKVGDKATIVGRPLKSGEKGMSLFYLEQPDGSRLYQDIGRPKDPEKKG
jgi:hypothetical protein